MGLNDGGIKRGDRAETGDLTARPKRDADEEGSGVGGHITADPSAGGLGKGQIRDRPKPTSDPFPIGGLDDLTIKSADDPSLGMTNIRERGPDDWAADTGETRSAEGETNFYTRELHDAGSTLVDDKHLRDHSPDEGSFNIGPSKEEGAKKGGKKKKAS